MMDGRCYQASLMMVLQHLSMTLPGPLKCGFELYRPSLFSLERSWLVVDMKQLVPRKAPLHVQAQLVETLLLLRLHVCQSPERNACWRLVELLGNAAD